MHNGVVALFYFGVNKRVIKIKNSYIYIFTVIYVGVCKFNYTKY